MTQYLEPGRYVWICPIEDESGAPHFGKGEVKPFVVYDAGAAEADRAAAPEADIVVRLLDFGFAFEPHDLVMMKLAPGISAADVETALNPERARRDAPAAEPPPFESLGTLIGGIAAIGPGRETFLDVDFTPGEYVLICMATAPDGRSHIEHGMIRQVSVQ